MPATFSPDPVHLLDGAGTLEDQIDRDDGRLLADYENGGWYEDDDDGPMQGFIYCSMPPQTITDFPRTVHFEGKQFGDGPYTWDVDGVPGVASTAVPEWDHTFGGSPGMHIVTMTDAAGTSATVHPVVSNTYTTIAIDPASVGAGTDGFIVAVTPTPNPPTFDPTIAGGWVDGEIGCGTEWDGTAWLVEIDVGGGGLPVGAHQISMLAQQDTGGGFDHMTTSAALTVA